MTGKVSSKLWPSGAQWINAPVRAGEAAAPVFEPLLVAYLQPNIGRLSVWICFCRNQDAG